MLMQTADVGRARSSCARRFCACIPVFLCSQRWPGRQQAVVRTETYSCACFSSSALLAKVCLPLAGDASYLLQAFRFCFYLFFSLFLRGPCPITFFSASLLFLLQLPLLWPVSQQLSCWNSQCAGTTKDRFPKAEPQSGFDSSFDNFFFTNTTVTACSFFRSLKVNLRDAFWILGRQLNWNNCWQVVWKGCLSSGVIGFSKGGCVGWSVTAVSHTTNSFFQKAFFLLLVWQSFSKWSISAVIETFIWQYLC